jgi:hypothetical protein
MKFSRIDELTILFRRALLNASVENKNAAFAAALEVKSLAEISN